VTVFEILRESLSLAHDIGIRLEAFSFPQGIKRSTALQ
jgi:hypothetical protein